MDKKKNMTPQKLRIANSLMSDIEFCQRNISSWQISLRELKDIEENKTQIRYFKRAIAIEQDKQVALEKEFKNL